MLPAFSFASAPFDGLTASEQALLLASAEPARFARDAVLLTPESPVGHAWLLVEGHVQQIEAGEVVALDGPGDLCAARAALAGRAERPAARPRRRARLADSPDHAAGADRRQCGFQLLAVRRHLASSGGRGPAPAAARVRVADDGAGARCRRTQAGLHRRRPRPRLGVPRDVAAGPAPCAGSRRRAGRHVHHHRSPRRPAAAGAAAAAGGARGRALRADRPGARCRGVRGLAADDPAPRASRAGARRRNDRRRAQPARPDELRLHPFEPGRAADRAGFQRCRVEAGGPADGRHDRAAAQRRHPHRARGEPGARAEPPAAGAPVDDAGAGRTGRQQLPDRDGQRRARRADPQDRPGQRAAAARWLRHWPASSR